ncbi:MAG: phosphoribosylglycinamide formyltransferase [Rhodoferax sp.]|nr:phosphoribosylglycinamide formyltransferase [Rhodoferax sp.]
MHNIVILISGGGSNMEAIVNASRREDWERNYHAKVAAVISNRADAPGLILARTNGIAAEFVEHGRFASRSLFEAQLADAIDRHAGSKQPVLLLLAGFMRILSADFVLRYEGRIVNIHPSLLPAFPGLHTHRRALESGCKVAGATVHLVTAALDCGPILAQAVVPVLDGDTERSLAARVLTLEHRIYPQAIAQMLQRQCAWDNRGDASKGFA